MVFEGKTGQRASEDTVGYSEVDELSDWEEGAKSDAD